MKIQIITNYYPPSNYGWGYMQLCEEVTNGLAARGHEIAVLTSTRRDGPEIPRPYPVHRLLTIDPDWNSDQSAAWQFFFGRRRREEEAVRHFHRLVEQFCPDVIFVWHYIGLPRSVLRVAEALPETEVAYYLAGYHPELPDEYISYWRSAPDGLFLRMVKPLLARVAIQILSWEGKPVQPKYEHVACVSRYVRDRLASRGLISRQAVVIHNGVDLEDFVSQRDRLPAFGTDGLRCVVAGHVKPEKGVHTAIEALHRLDHAELAKVRLSIVGDGPAAYLARLRGLTSQYGLQRFVTFVPPVVRREMPAILGQHNTLLLPTEYAEPLARSMQEAMAVGLLVLATLTGGTGELLAHEQTGLAFDAGDPDSLALQMRRALNDPTLAVRLADDGQKAVRERFNIARTIARTEEFLGHVVEG